MVTEKAVEQAEETEVDDEWDHYICLFERGKGFCGVKLDPNGPVITADEKSYDSECPMCIAVWAVMAPRCPVCGLPIEGHGYGD